MFELMGKEINANLGAQTILIWTYGTQYTAFFNPLTLSVAFVAFSNYFLMFLSSIFSMGMLFTFVAFFNYFLMFLSSFFSLGMLFDFVAFFNYFLMFLNSFFPMGMLFTFVAFLTISPCL